MADEKRPYSVIGVSVPRIDGVEKITGRAKFTVDIALPGMLHAKILRSPHPHARILAIRTDKALALPGVKAVITGKDAADVRYAFVDTPRYPADEQPLKVDKVRYVGDEVAAVAAESLEIAEAALNLIEVDYEVLPAVFRPEEAMSWDAPRIHEQSYKTASAWEKWGARQGGKREEYPHNNISAHTHVVFGEPEAGFAEADYVRQDRFHCPATAHCAMEPHAAVASWDPLTGRMDLWLSTMGVFYKRWILSQAMNLPLGKVRVQHSYCGGAFGGKIDVYPYEFVAAYLSMQTGRPVRIELTREECFTTTRQRHPVTVDIKTGVKRDGRIVAQQIQTIADNGGYRGTAAVVCFLMHGFSFPIYNVPNYQYDGWGVYTNSPIRGPQRGHGAPQIRFAIDSQLDMIARDLGLDPAEVMLKNVRHKGDQLPNGDVLNSCGLEDGIKSATRAIGWAERRQQPQKGRYRRGVGISLCAMFSGAAYYPFASAATIKLHGDGSATLFTGAQEIGQGIYTVMAQIAAEELGLGMADIQVVAGDTELCPIDLGSFLSGGAMVTGGAVQRAARDVRRQLFDVAAELLKASPDELEARERQIRVKGEPQRALPLADVVLQSVHRRGGNPVVGTGSRQGVEGVSQYPSLAKAVGRFTDAYGFAAQVAEVEVDTWTGEVRLVRSSTFHDCGNPLNPQIVAGQVHGCVSNGQGQTLLEEVMFQEGRMVNPNFLEYRLPLSTETPEYVDGHVVTWEPMGPFGAKEVGEGALAGILAAIANAVNDAVGVRIQELPITPEKVLNALVQQKKQVGVL